MKPSTIITRLLLASLTSVLLLACAGENNDDNGKGDGNQVPVISGTPANTVNEGSAYHFTPTASDGDSNDSLTFSITNKPFWAGFNNQTGILNGTPGLDDANDYGNIISDGNASAQLSTFTISVIDTSQSLGTTLSWSKPINRADSAALAMSEISGYRIYYGTMPNKLKILAVMTDNSATRHTTTPLGANTYYFAVTTYDIGKAESAFSNIESKPYRRRRLITIQS